jgi:hypothetical protein
MSLLLDIGLPKTGTTTRQTAFESVVPPGYRLRGQVLPFSDPRGIAVSATSLIRPLVEEGFAYPPATVVNQIRDVVKDPSRTFVFSFEGLTAILSRAWTAPPIDRVSALIELLDPDLSNTRIICGIRPPAPWLASTYAEAPVRGSLNQFVHLFMSLGEADIRVDVLNYDHMDVQLSGLVGPSRVTFLPIAEIGTQKYWQQACAGTALDWRPIFAARKHIGAANVRQKPDGSWRASPRPRLRAWLAEITSPGSRARRVIVSPYNLPLRAASALTWRPRPKIVLTPELEDLIIARYAESNRRFAARRGLDLDGHGYW